MGGTPVEAAGGPVLPALVDEAFRRAGEARSGGDLAGAVTAFESALEQLRAGPLRAPFVARVQLGRGGDRRRQSLQATELVHEAFVRLVDQRAEWHNRLHFYGIAAKCMRRILIDHARKKSAAKRPPAGAAVDIDDAPVGGSGGVDTLLALDLALERLAAQNPRQAQIAELKLFGGLELTEIAQVTGVSIATVKRDWTDAKKFFTAAI